MLRQYFMALRTVGQWRRLSEHWVEVAENCDTPVSPIGIRHEEFPTQARISQGVAGDKPIEEIAKKVTKDAGKTWTNFLLKRLGLHLHPHDENVESSDDEGLHRDNNDDQIDFDVLLMRKFFTKWAIKAGVKSSVCDPLKVGEFTVDWTRLIAPVVEGRIKMVE